MRVKIPVAYSPHRPELIHYVQLSIQAPTSQLVEAYKVAIIFLSRENINDNIGPVKLYQEVINIVTQLGIFGVQMKFGQPADLPGNLCACANDTEAVMNWLTTNMKLERFLLVGWSFAGPVALQVAADVKNEKRVAGVATLGFQCQDISQNPVFICPRPVFFIHGKKDTIVHPNLSKNLYNNARASRHQYFPLGVDHEFKKFADIPQKLAQFCYMTLFMNIQKEINNT
ncbi:hypothetical protein G9A89_019627 [Geosiphon pyriformis]|nr:hypothetical protein G9A89_019627 [Geosiphon pyriformis]